MEFPDPPKGTEQPTPFQSNHRTISISMRDWNRRQISLYDVQTILGVENDVANEYGAVSAHLQAHLELYNGPNPFIPVLPFTFYEKFKIFLFIISGILLIKILLIALIAIWWYLMALGISVCNSDMNVALLQRRKLSCFRRPFRYGIILGCRAVLFIAGFYWIPFTKHKTSNNNSNSNNNGEVVRDTTEENEIEMEIHNNTQERKVSAKARIITPNHVSLVDGFIIFVLYGLFNFFVYFVLLVYFCLAQGYFVLQVFFGMVKI